MARTAQVKRDARIGEAEARRDATIRVGSKTIPALITTSKLLCFKSVFLYAFVQWWIFVTL